MAFLPFDEIEVGRELNLPSVFLRNTVRGVKHCSVTPPSNKRDPTIGSLCD